MRLKLGDVKTLQQVANGPALREALRITSVGRKMEWRIKTPSEGGAGSTPMISWVAVTSLPEFPEYNVAQICVRFDTTQVLTLNPVKQSALQPPPSRVQRVVEYVVLEKVFPNGGEWKIKAKVNAETPKWVKDWEIGKAMPLSQYLLSFLPTWLGGTPAGDKDKEKK
ncbi:hypothetical protein BCR39DRAFT_195511 [Naematelia encephala]|uniref:Uncharacterized protein n=1 Tax=Naematelia encephala TaxID=71784 RepID=A0A1Y2BHS0_9TREE|nr:hypothetical protein BCR39DRAFT_195511 [Naematelia encephala]